MDPSVLEVEFALAETAMGLLAAREARARSAVAVRNFMLSSKT